MGQTLQTSSLCMSYPQFWLWQCCIRRDLPSRHFYPSEPTRNIKRQTVTTQNTLCAFRVTNEVFSFTAHHIQYVLHIYWKSYLLGLHSTTQTHVKFSATLHEITSFVKLAVQFLRPLFQKGVDLTQVTSWEIIRGGVALCCILFVILSTVCTWIAWTGQQYIVQAIPVITKQLRAIFGKGQRAFCEVRNCTFLAFAFIRYWRLKSFHMASS